MRAEISLDNEPNPIFLAKMIIFFEKLKRCKIFGFWLISMITYVCGDNNINRSCPITRKARNRTFFDALDNVNYCDVINVTAVL